MRKGKRTVILVSLCFVLLLIGCKAKETGDSETESVQTMEDSQEDECSIEEEEQRLCTMPLEKLGMKREDIVVDIPAIKDPYQFLVIADLHVGCQSDEVLEKETVEQRIQSYSLFREKSTEENWKDLVPALNETNADGILFAGDMVDFASQANLNCLKKGMDTLEIPFMYIRADHDVENYYCSPEIREQTDALQGSIVPNASLFSFSEEGKKENRFMQGQMEENGNASVFTWEYEEFMIVGMNFTTSQISSEALTEFRALTEKGKPIILLIHVPLNSLIDDSLNQKSREQWGDRNLTWGQGAYYLPDSNTAEFLELIYAKDSVVKEVISGHLHFPWNGYVTEELYQHVCSPAFEGYYSVLTIY